MNAVVCLSVRLSVCNEVYCGAQGRCRGWKLYRRVPSRALPVHFFRHFLVISCTRGAALRHTSSPISRMTEAYTPKYCWCCCSPTQQQYNHSSWKLLCFTLKIRVEYGVESWAQKPAISLKRCQIGRTKVTRSDVLIGTAETHCCRKNVLRSPPGKKLNEDRPPGPISHVSTFLCIYEINNRSRDCTVKRSAACLDQQQPNPIGSYSIMLSPSVRPPASVTRRPAYTSRRSSWLLDIKRATSDDD